MGRRLTTNVHVGGTWYGPAHGPPPDDVAALLDRSLFEADEAPKPEPKPEVKAAPARATAAKKK